HVKCVEPDLQFARFTQTGQSRVLPERHIDGLVMWPTERVPAHARRTWREIEEVCPSAREVSILGQKDGVGRIVVGPASKAGWTDGADKLLARSLQTVVIHRRPRKSAVIGEDTAELPTAEILCQAFVLVAEDWQLPNAGEHHEMLHVEIRWSVFGCQVTRKSLIHAGVRLSK